MKYKYGDFSFIKCKMELRILSNAFNFVEDNKLWDFFNAEPPSETGYMFWNSETLGRISKGLDDDGHSGASFAFTMRTIQNIHKIGWEVYVDKYLRIT